MKDFVVLIVVSCSFVNSRRKEQEKCDPRYAQAMTHISLRKNGNGSGDGTLGTSPEHT